MSGFRPTEECTVDTQQQQQQHETRISKREKRNSSVSRKNLKCLAISGRSDGTTVAVLGGCERSRSCARRHRLGRGRGRDPREERARSRRRGLDIGRERNPVSGRDDRRNFGHVHSLLGRHKRTYFYLRMADDRGPWHTYYE